MNRRAVMVYATSFMLLFLLTRLAFYSSTTTNHVWRGALLAGIVIGNVLNGAAFIVWALVLIRYGRNKGGENNPMWVIWTFSLALGFDGLGHLVGVMAVFVSRNFAAGAVTAASTFRCVSALVSIFGAIFLPRAFAKMSAEPSKLELINQVRELKETRELANAAAVQNPSIDSIQRIRDKVDELLARSENLLHQQGGGAAVAQEG